MLVAVVGLAAACGSGVKEITDGVQGRANQAFYSGPQWSDYLPAQSERVCTYSSSYTDEDLGLDYMYLGTGDVETLEYNDAQTLEYTDFRTEFDGKHLTLTTTTESTAPQSEDGETYDVPLFVPETQTSNTCYSEPVALAEGRIHRTGS